jgi:hypothetical protein
MKKNIFLLTLVSLSFVFLGCPKASFTPDPIFPGNGPWDYTSLNEVIVDSTTQPYTITTYDTSFGIHTQFAYQSPDPSDSIIMINYKVQPNVITGGWGSRISNNELVLTFTGASPDTFGWIRPNIDSIYLTHAVNGQHISHTITQLFSLRGL